MTGEDLCEKDIMWFDDLVQKAAKLHSMTWCVKNCWPRFTRSLKGRECLTCPDFTMKGGVCDPL